MPHTPLSPTEQAVLRALLSADGRVVSRATIARDCGLGHLSARRADSVVAALRRRLGSDALVTVRQRGWMLTVIGAELARSMLPPSL
ncbi:MAG: winged helix-turn-helix domain-containing protein [Actinomycetota bacterium]